MFIFILSILDFLADLLSTSISVEKNLFISLVGILKFDYNEKFFIRSRIVKFIRTSFGEKGIKIKYLRKNCNSRHLTPHRRILRCNNGYISGTHHSLFHPLATVGHRILAGPATMHNRNSRTTRQTSL